MFGRKGNWPRLRGIDFNALLSWLGLAVGLLGLACALFGLTFAVEDGTALAVLWIGVAASAIPGAAILLFHFLKGWRPIREWIERRREYDYKQRTGDHRHLKKVVAAGRRAIGPAHPGTRTLRQRLAENPEVLRVCGREWRNGRFEFCGYVLLYPITDETAEKIIGGSIRAEREFGLEPLTGTFAESRYVYVAMVLGTDRHAKSHVKDKLRDEMIKVLSLGRVEKVFARPGSKGGLELMQEYGFNPIAAEDGVWSVSGTALRGRLHLEDAPSERIDLSEKGDSTTSRKKGETGSAS